MSSLADGRRKKEEAVFIVAHIQSTHTYIRDASKLNFQVHTVISVSPADVTTSFKSLLVSALMFSRCSVAVLDHFTSSKALES